MSSSSTPKQQQQQQRRRLNNNNSAQHSRNTNAYFDRDEYHRSSAISKKDYFNQAYHEGDEDFYPPRNSSYSIQKGRQIKNEQRYQAQSYDAPAYYHQNIPPRHREQHSSRLPEPKTNHRQEEIKSSHEQPIKPLQSASSSSINSDISTHAESTNRRDLRAKNLTAAALAARQQNSQPQTNLNMVQTLMNSLILQQQQQQPSPPSSQAPSTVQLQYQLTNALLATMIQQRLKETALQAQAQQIQAAIPTLLAAQALVYQQSGQLSSAPQPPNVAHPGTKFNNRPLVKYAVAGPAMTMPGIRPAVTTNVSRHRLGASGHQTNSTTVLPTYRQVQEIERGISLDEAIHFKGAINVADVDNNSSIEERAATPKITG